MSKPTAKQKGKTTDDFRALFDKNYIIPKKIKAALDELGPNIWELEKDFIARAKISTTDFAMFRDDFKDFIVEAKNPNRHPQRCWCGSKALATKLRAMAT